MKKISASVRLRQLMTEQNVRPVDVLEKCKPLCEKHGIKISKANLSQWMSGLCEPTYSKAFILSQVFDVSDAWLMGFDVPKKRG